MRAGGIRQAPPSRLHGMRCEPSEEVGTALTQLPGAATLRCPLRHPASQPAWNHLNQRATK